jgi:pimeloyl-ACP methyl ester carboxylesterase
MRQKHLFSFIASMMMLVALSFASCKSSSKPAADATTQDSIPEALAGVEGIEKYQTKLDYSKAECWLERPAEATKAVDVFYIYPTVTGFRDPVQICEITDSELVAGAKMVRQIQTSVFDESCNVFMPYYRQISMPKPGYDYPAIIDYISGFDATDALDYFLNNLNQDRPFILAGHSQGAATLIALLQNYMTKHPEALKRMIAAYPIGYAVTKDFLARTGFKFAESATDTGVIVSWNTEGAANKDAFNCTLAPGGISINPINWKRDDTYASVKDNLGSLTVEGKLVTPGIADARIDTVRGSVIVTTVDAPAYAIPADGAPLFGPESYHLHDYGLFYNNFKQNVADRVKAFTGK